MAEYTHAELCEVAVRWLRNKQGCGAVVSELASIGGEQPDAIGWKFGHSYLIEVKTSRSDFFADQKKKWRQPFVRSMGMVRYYMTPKELIGPDEVPDGWGLLWAYGKRPCVQVVRGVNPSQIPPDAYRWNDRDAESELMLACSALRRLQSADQ